MEPTTAAADTQDRSDPAGNKKGRDKYFMQYGPLLSRGRTAEVYELVDGKILKLFFQWCPIDWIEGEAKKAEYAYSMDICSPQCQGIIEVDNRKGIIYERIYGKTMLNHMMSAPWTIKKHTKMLAQLHQGIHKTDGNTLPSLKKYLNDTVASSKVLNENRKSEIKAILGRLEDGTSLCHFDFHPDQVIITNEGPYIIDWMTAFKGNPLADVARTSILYSYGYPPNTNAFMKPLIDIARKRILNEYLKEYLSDGNSKAKYEIKLWSIPVAAARLHENIPGLNDMLLKYIDKMLNEIRNA